jgi:hypothetical protein
MFLLQETANLVSGERRKKIGTVASPAEIPPARFLPTKFLMD